MKGRKRHILVDTEGLLLRVVCLPADIQDWDGAEDLFLVSKPVSPRLELVWADSAYGRNDLPAWTAEACGWRLEIVSRPAGGEGLRGRAAPLGGGADVRAGSGATAASPRTMRSWPRRPRPGSTRR